MRTLALYEAWFEPPPADLWPDTGTRFGRRPAFVMVDSRRHLVMRLPVPRLVAWLRALGPAALFAAILVHAEPARAEGLGVLDWTAGPFLAFYLAAIAVSAVAARYLPLVIAAPPLDPRQGRFEPVELAMLAGGRERAADVLILEAIAAGDATVSGRVIMVDGWSRDRGELIRASTATLDGVQARLAARGLVLRPRRRLAFRCVTLAAMIPVLVLGGAKLAVGVEREKPVGILVFLLVVTSVATLTFAAKRRPATLPGRQAVKVYRAENPRAIRAPRADEVIAAFACVGAKALLCTDLSAYGELLKPSADGGGDAGGCGGGGCGGCGG